MGKVTNCEHVITRHFYVQKASPLAEYLDHNDIITMGMDHSDGWNFEVCHKCHLFGTIASSNGC